jgi:hypothetical protein
VVRVRRRADRVDRDLDAAGGAVLEADRHREARGELPVHLALAGSRADRAPGDEVRDELRGDRVEELAACGHPHLGQVEQEAARHAQALVDLEALVELRVVDQALPADDRARLLEVHAHHDQQILAQLLGQALEARRVLAAGGGVVDGAGADHRQQAVVLLAQDPFHLLPAVGHRGRALLPERELLHQDRRRQQRPQGVDAEVVGAKDHGASTLAGSLRPVRAGP